MPSHQQVVEQLTLQVRTLPYFKKGYEKDMVFHVGVGLQLVPARVTKSTVTDDVAELELALEKPLILHPVRELTLSYLNAKGPRVAGKVVGWMSV